MAYTSDVALGYALCVYKEIIRLCFPCHLLSKKMIHYKKNTLLIHILLIISEFNLCTGSGNNVFTKSVSSLLCVSEVHFLCAS